MLLKSGFSLIILMLFASTFALAQNNGSDKDKDKSDLAPLAAAAPLADVQDWLIKALSKNFGYSTTDDSAKISNIKFDGCQMSFRLYEKYSSQYAKVGDRPALGNTDSTQSNEKQYSSYSDVLFNLKDIDPAKTALGVLPHPKNMQVISLQTHNDQKLVSVDRKSDDIRFGGKENQGSLLFPVKDPSGQPIGMALKRAAFLCQAPK